MYIPVTVQNRKILENPEMPWGETAVLVFCVCENYGSRLCLVGKSFNDPIYAGEDNSVKKAVSTINASELLAADRMLLPLQLRQPTTDACSIIPSNI